jgi:hypothetical protein
MAASHRGTGNLTDEEVKRLKQQGVIGERRQGCGRG